MPWSLVLSLKKVHLNEERGLEIFRLFRKLLIPEKPEDHFEALKTWEDCGMWNRKAGNT